MRRPLQVLLGTTRLANGTLSTRFLESESLGRPHAWRGRPYAAKALADIPAPSRPPVIAQGCVFPTTAPFAVATQVWLLHCHDAAHLYSFCTWFPTACSRSSLARPAPLPAVQPQPAATLTLAVAAATQVLLLRSWVCRLLV